MPQPKIICPEKMRLAEKHNQAALVFARATIALNQVRAAYLLLKYRQLRQATEEARIKSEEAGLALTRHIEEHGCAETVALGMWKGPEAR